jgi:ParB family transcriptional regulator, chromosome partitioning protein
MAARKRPVTKSGTPRARKGVKLRPTELKPAELSVTDPSAEVAALSAAVKADGGAVLSIYREPLGGHVLLLTALPVEQVERTPFQRDVSDGHVRRLTVAMDKTRRYLDPIIATREADGRYLTPNGGHRLTALKELGAKSVLALLVPEREVAYQILALNIEKAHNLREKALEVARMYEDLAASLDPKETEMELQFEEAALATLGFAYQERGRLSGSVYAPILRKVDTLLAQACSKAMDERRRRARLVLGLDDAVAGAVARLKEKGFDSPYLKAFVVGRINPLRFMKGAPPEMDELFAQMTKRAAGMDAGKVKGEDVARSGGPAEAE